MNDTPCQDFPEFSDPPTAEQVASVLKLFVPDDQIVELRALGVRRQYGRPRVESGFFDAGHLDSMAQWALRLTPLAKGVYFTLNPLHCDLLARRANRVDYAEEGELAKDKDVLERRWLLVDVDPIRDSLISSTDAEKEEARTVALKIRDFLRTREWPEPIFADSGNGYHLLYAVSLPRDDGRWVESILRALGEDYDTSTAKVDRTVFNPARICKLPGTLARKGDSTEERPHRRSRILEVTLP